MKTSIAKVALGLTIAATYAAFSSVAMAAAPGSTGIANTKHNLGSTGGWNTNSATTEICVFCHTPHGANTSASVPLWNRSLSSTVTYNTYSSLNTSSLDAKSTSIGSVSLACLSCHDGTQAINTMLNEPGSGTSSPAGPLGSHLEFDVLSDALGGDMMLNLGTDLRNDHPISIQYAGALIGGTVYNRGALDTDFKPAAVTSSAAGADTLYYIDTDGTTGKSKSDLPLYNRSGGTQTSTGGVSFTANSLVGQPLVECATCHDPHRDNTTFLRNDSGNDVSATCLSCHVK